MAEPTQPLCCFRNVSPDVTRASMLLYTLIKNREHSLRGHQLSSEVIANNPSNYTAWWYRRLCLPALKNEKTVFMAELEYARQWCRSCPKNYQAWFHRRWVIQALGDTCDELVWLSEDLAIDPKNMNVWAHRQFITGLLKSQFKKRAHLKDRSDFTFLKYLFLEGSNHCSLHFFCNDEDSSGTDIKETTNFSLCLCWYENEFKFSHQMIEEDFRNNTAWTCRRKTIVDFIEEIFKKRNKLANFEEMIHRIRHHEITYILNYCQLAPSNESPWLVLESLFWTATQIALQHRIFPHVTTEKTSSHNNPEMTPKAAEKQHHHQYIRCDWTEDESLSLIEQTIQQILIENPYSVHALRVFYLIAISTGTVSLAIKTVSTLIECDPMRSTFWSDTLEWLKQYQ